MKRNHVTILLVGSVLFLGFSFAGHAQTNLQVFNITFAGQTPGTEPPTSYGPPFPETNLTAVGYDGGLNDGQGFPGSTPGQTHTIGSAAGFTSAVIMSNSVNAAAFDSGSVNWLDTDFNVSDPKWQQSKLTFDVAMISRPFGDNGGFRSDWAVVANDSGGRAFVFAFSHHDTGSNVIELENNGGVNIPIGVYTQGVPVNVEIDSFFFGGGYYNVLLNGNLAAQYIPFRDPMTSPSDQPGEFYIQQISATNGVAPNVVAFNDLQYTVMIPEASPILLAAIGLLTFGAIFRRARRKI